MTCIRLYKNQNNVLFPNFSIGKLCRLIFVDRLHPFFSIGEKCGLRSHAVIAVTACKIPPINRSLSV